MLRYHPGRAIGHLVLGLAGCVLRMRQKKRVNVIKGQEMRDKDNNTGRSLSERFKHLSETIQEHNVVRSINMRVNV